jgi:hypothetical protein
MLPLALTCLGVPTAMVMPPTWAQIIPKDAAVPVEVRKPHGDFAKRLNGAVMPTGGGWKAVTDTDKRLQLMIPDKWRVDPEVDGDTVIHAYPPGNEKAPRAQLLVVFTSPRDADPLDMDEEFASQYAQEMADLPELKKAQFTATDSGYVLARDLKFALAGGTLVKTTRKKMQEKYFQQQLLHFGPDRIVSVQFSAVEADFAGYAADVAKIFASYQNLGVRRLDDDEP